MFYWFYGDYFYKTDLIKMIDEIDGKRKLKRLKGGTMNSTFSDDLKNALNGIEEIEDFEETKKLNKLKQKEKSLCESELLYSNSKEENENIKLYIENQFKNN